MHLQDHPAAQAGCGQALVDPHEGDFKNVGGESLDSGVHCLTLAHLSNSIDRARQLRDRSAAMKDRLGVTALSSLRDRLIHVPLNVRKGFEICIEYHRRLVDTNRQSLGQAIRLHPVGETIRNHLGLAALVRTDVLRRNIKHACRRRRVNICAIEKRRR